MPYEEIQHTADWGLRIWAGDLPGLFIEAARGMNTLMGVQAVPTEGAIPAPGPAESDTGQRSPLRRLILTAPDVEALLVAFLSEMLYLVEQEHITLDNLQVSLFPGEALWRLEAVGEARPLARVQKLIKAVTYYNLHIRSDEDGYSVEVVFDV